MLLFERPGKTSDVTSWTLYNASGPEPTLVAESLESEPLKVYDKGVWAAVQRQANE